MFVALRERERSPSIHWQGNRVRGEPMRLWRNLTTCDQYTCMDGQDHSKWYKDHHTWDMLNYAPAYTWRGSGALDRTYWGRRDGWGDQIGGWRFFLHGKKNLQCAASPHTPPTPHILIRAWSRSSKGGAEPRCVWLRHSEVAQEWARRVSLEQAAIYGGTQQGGGPGALAGGPRRGGF